MKEKIDPRMHIWGEVELSTKRGDRQTVVALDDNEYEMVMRHRAEVEAEQKYDKIDRLIQVLERYHDWKNGHIKPVWVDELSGYNDFLIEKDVALPQFKNNGFKEVTECFRFIEQMVENG